MASKVQIANKGLQKIGASRIGAFEENSNNANAVREVYDMLRQSELQTNYWVFAIKRTTLAADTATPTFGRTYQFTLPGDFLRVAPQDPSFQRSFSDWLVEGDKILTTEGSTLNLRYSADITDDEKFSPVFADALSMRIAMELAEPLTQSASKQQAAETQYKYFMDQAKKINAIEAGPIAREVDEMVAVRSGAYFDRSMRPYED